MAPVINQKTNNFAKTCAEARSNSSEKFFETTIKPACLARKIVKQSHAADKRSLLRIRGKTKKKDKN